MHYLSHEGKPVRIVFTFTSDGKICKRVASYRHRRLSRTFLRLEILPEPVVQPAAAFQRNPRPK